MGYVSYLVGVEGMYSPLRPTMRRLMVGGSCLRLAFSVEEGLSMPLVRKPSILRRRVLSVVASRFAAHPGRFSRL